MGSTCLIYSLEQRVRVVIQPIIKLLRIWRNVTPVSDFVLQTNIGTIWSLWTLMWNYCQLTESNLVCSFEKRPTSHSVQSLAVLQSELGTHLLGKKSNKNNFCQQKIEANLNVARRVTLTEEPHYRINCAAVPKRVCIGQKNVLRSRM